MDPVEQYKKEVFTSLKNEYEAEDSTTVRAEKSTPEDNTITKTEKLTIEKSDNWKIVENTPEYALIEHTQ